MQPTQMRETRRPDEPRLVYFIFWDMLKRVEWRLRYYMRRNHWGVVKYSCFDDWSDVNWPWSTACINPESVRKLRCHPSRSKINTINSLYIIAVSADFQGEFSSQISSCIMPKQSSRAWRYLPFSNSKRPELSLQWFAIFLVSIIHCVSLVIKFAVFRFHQAFNIRLCLLIADANSAAWLRSVKSVPNFEDWSCF